jgi:hypothetical protein
MPLAKIVLARTVVPALLTLLSGLVLPGVVFGYHYTDDFSTDKALTESNSHSLVAETLPELSFQSVIGYGECPGGSRALGFVCGFDALENAFICYKLPPTGGWRTCYGGQIYFTACQDRGAFHFLNLTVSYYGVAGGSTYSMTQPGYYYYGLQAGADYDSVLVRFEGDRALLDDLVVDLFEYEPTDAATWGQIKSLYR